MHTLIDDIRYVLDIAEEIREANYWENFDYIKVDSINRNSKGVIEILIVKPRKYDTI